MLTASPRKMKDGAWGARVNGEAKVGDYISIVAKSGRQWVAEVTEVFWVGESKYGDTAGKTISLVSTKNEM